MSEADALIRRLFALADEGDKQPGRLGEFARDLANDLEEYFILFGRPDARVPEGVINATARTLTPARRKWWAKAVKEIRQRNHDLDVLEGILDETNAAVDDDHPVTASPPRPVTRCGPEADALRETTRATDQQFRALEKVLDERTPDTD